MKNSYLRWMGCLLLGLAVARPAIAQTSPADTARLRYDEEQRPATGLPPVPRQERDQWKVGLNNFIVNGYPFSQTKDVPGYYTRYGLHLAYERRLGRAWSGQVELSPALLHYRAEGAGGPPVASAQLRAQVAGRYYYNREHRLRRGHRTVGFAANYVALALGLGLSSGPSETPYHLLATGTGPATDAALLYGLQRRLGRYGFVDLNAGLSGALRAGHVQDVGPVASLRVGLALPFVARTAPQEAQPDEVQALLPRFFVGFQVGDARYHTHYTRANALPVSYQEIVNGYEKYVLYYPYHSGSNGAAAGTHEYDNDKTYYLYGGYYLKPRLALQVGVQYGASRSEFERGAVGIRRAGDDYHYVRTAFYDEFILAVPVQVRYALTRSFQRRLQVEAVGGLTPVRSGVTFREYETDGYTVTDRVRPGTEFRRRALTLAANLGGALSYGLGHRRRMQFTVDYGLQQDLHNLFSAPENLTTYAKAGLRYRFGYR